MRQLVAAALSSVIAVAAGADAPPAKRDITIDDYFTQSTASDIAVSPDGSQVAWAEARWQASTDDRKSDLWVADVESRRMRRLTSDRGAVRSIKWSADGKHVWHLGNRKREGELRPPYDGSTQVWKVPAEGGEAEAVTRIEGGVTGYDLAGGFVWFATTAETVDGEWARLRAEHRGPEYGHGVYRWSVLWRMGADNLRTERMLSPKKTIKEFAVCEDGGLVAMITAPDDSVASHEGKSDVEIYDVARHETSTLPDRLWRADAPSPHGWLMHLAWSQSRKPGRIAIPTRRLAFQIVFDAYPSEILVADLGADRTVHRLQRPEGVSLHGYGGHMCWRGADELLWPGDERARTRVYAAEVPPGKPPGASRVLTPGDVVCDGLSTASAGDRTAFLMNDATHLPDIYVADRAGAPKRLTDLNPQTKNWKLPQLRIVQWKSADGTPVEGVLELPADWKPGTRLPMMVSIHGGPTTADGFHLQFWFYGRVLFPARGYAVLCPNYRGSTGYGDKFLTALVGRENDLDTADILAGVDAMIEQGYADPSRLGVSGWSNGGYLTNCLIAKTDRFKAAGSGAGILDTVMEWGVSDEPAYATAFKQGLPWDRPEAYRKASPLWTLNKAKTPTLIHVGAGDDRCPPGHSRMLYRALRELNVPTELIVYPGEGHGLMKYRHRRIKMDWDAAWFDRYILGR